MAQPELIKDIEARVKKSGDIMTGTLKNNLFLSNDNNETNGGINYGIHYNDPTIAQSGLGSIRGEYTLALLHDCNYTNEAKQQLIGERCFYYNDTDTYQHFPSALTMENDGKIYYSYASDGLVSRTQYQKITMNKYEVLHTGNINLADNRYVLKSGDTMTGMLRVNNAPIFGYRYGQSHNAPAFILDKPSSHYSGIGANGSSDTIYFGAVNTSTLEWENSYKQKWVFNGSVTADTFYYKGLRMQSYEITVGGDLNTYYPVAVDSYLYGNTEAIIITVSKTLGTTSPAWSGNHSNGTSSLMASYLIRNNGWDGNGAFAYSITPPQQSYAKILSHAESRGSAAHHLVFWLRGGGATYRIAANIPTTINVYLSTANLGDSSYPNNVSPRTDIGNAGWLFENPVYLPIKGGTVDGNIRANNVYGAVWNDYAEYRSSDPIEPGRVICETGNGTLKLSIERLQPGANVVSDTFGFAIGETENCETPIAVSGRALVYTYEDRYSYAAGDPVCAAPGGTVSKMSREEVMMYPDRIVGTVSEIPEYERWGTGNVEVKNRIWIKVK